MTTTDDWRSRLLADVEEQPREVSAFAIKRFRATKSQVAATTRAARKRGISTEGYIRRAVLAMVCHDLGIPWDEMMADEGPVGRFGRGGVHDREPKRGKGFGEWQIERLH